MKTQAENVIDFDQIKNRKTSRSNNKIKKSKKFRRIFLENFKFFKKTVIDLFKDTAFSFFYTVKPAIKRLTQFSIFISVLSLFCVFTKSNHKMGYIFLSLSLMVFLIIIYAVVMKFLSLRSEDIKESTK